MIKLSLKQSITLAIALAISLNFISLAFAETTETSTTKIGESRSAIKASNKRSVRNRKLSNVCKKVTNLSGLLVKTTAGGHIPRSDPRYSGFSVVCASKCVPFPAKVYHCDGSEAFKMGYYGRWSGNGKSRGYCGSGGAKTCPTSTVRARNKKLKCAGAAYLDQGRGSCMRFNVNVNRNGGV